MSVGTVVQHDETLPQVLERHAVHVPTLGDRLLDMPQLDPRVTELERRVREVEDSEARLRRREREVVKREEAVKAKERALLEGGRSSSS